MELNNYMPDCLRPALLKCYNAFECLRKMSLDVSFFDNISNFDNFLIEYRSITFALQKSLGKNDDPIYIKNRDMYLKSASSKWLLDNRNIVDHEHPFELGIRLTIHVYKIDSAEEVYTEEFSIEHELGLKSVLEQVKEKFHSFRLLEVYFSCTFQFIDNDKKDDIYPYIKEGVTSAKNFLTAMYNDLKPKDTITDVLLSKVTNFHFDKIPKDMLFVQDYVYYIKNDTFERGSVLHLAVTDKRIPLKNFKKNIKGSNYWEYFVISHIVIYKKQDNNIMPTFVLIYKNNTFRMRSCQFTLRTTVYRIINEIADEIRKDYVKSVFIVCENYLYHKISDTNIFEFINTPYKERIEKLNPVTTLCFCKVKEDGTAFEYYFESSKIEDETYVTNTIKHGEITINGISFLTPIINAFKRKI